MVAKSRKVPEKKTLPVPASALNMMANALRKGQVTDTILGACAVLKVSADVV
jgi:hypothetical protein